MDNIHKMMVIQAMGPFFWLFIQQLCVEWKLSSHEVGESSSLISPHQLAVIKTLRTKPCMANQRTGHTRGCPGYW